MRNNSKAKSSLNTQERRRIRLEHRVRLVEENLGRGKTIEETAQQLGIQMNTLRQDLKHMDRLDLAPYRGTRSEERTDEMVEMAKQGLTLQKIGDHFGITRERVRQLLSRRNLTTIGLRPKKEPPTPRPVLTREQLVEQRRESIKTRIASKVSIDTSTGCWNWTGYAHQSKKYLNLRVPRMSFHDPLEAPSSGSGVAYRASYLAYVGEIAIGQWVQRTCGNNLCVNPDHLELYDTW